MSDPCLRLPVGLASLGSEEPIRPPLQGQPLPGVLRFYEEGFPGRFRELVTDPQGAASLVSSTALDPTAVPGNRLFRGPRCHHPGAPESRGQSCRDGDLQDRKLTPPKHPGT